MIHKRKHEDDVNASLLRENDPVFGASGLRKSSPKYNMPSLATFVTTWIEPEAAQLMNGTFDKNMIDKDANICN
ncbi:MAG: glutamate/tyrosine decarboxylase-like PLP-dependent enzyme [Sulfurimonas sp.]|jgi:glutamate/tyrosine decarboxylase-like PLP-dependent enzyme